MFDIIILMGARRVEISNIFGELIHMQTSLHQKYSISKIPWKYSCFRQKNAPSEQNWTLSIYGATVISDSYPIDRSMERYLRRLSVHFLALKMG